MTTPHTDFLKDGFLMPDSFMNTRTFVLNQQAIKGNLNLEECERLDELEYLIDCKENQLQFELTGFTNDRQQWCLNLKIEGQLAFVCSRCLEGMLLSIECENTILVAKNQTELELFDEHEELEAILTQKDLRILDLIEDEILLSLPYSPTHDDCELVEASQDDESNEN